MKKSYKLVMNVMAFIVAAFLLSLPITFMIDSSAKAAEGTSDKANADGTYVDEMGEDYIFVVLEDEEVPLAAAPTHTYSHLALSLVVCISLIIMLGVAYVSWYSMVRKNISNYSYLIPDSELKALVPARAFAHPIELHQAEFEIRYRAANKYM